MGKSGKWIIGLVVLWVASSVGLGYCWMQTSNELTKVKANLVTTQSTLVSTQEQLMASQDSLSSVRNDFQDTQTVLASTQNELQATTDNLTITKDSLTATQQVLQSTQDELTTTKNKLIDIQQTYPSKLFPTVSALKDWLNTQPTTSFNFQNTLALQEAAAKDGWIISFSIEYNTSKHAWAASNIAILDNGDIYFFTCDNHNIYFSTNIY